MKNMKFYSFKLILLVLLTIGVNVVVLLREDVHLWRQGRTKNETDSSMKKENWGGVTDGQSKISATLLRNSMEDESAKIMEIDDHSIISSSELQENTEEGKEEEIGGGNESFVEDMKTVSSAPELSFKKELSAPLHSCRSSDLVFPQARLLTPKNRIKKMEPIHIPYQCGGKEYEDVYDQVWRFAQNTTLHPTQWGRREFPVPDNKTVLMIGNSHSRQIYMALICQFADQIIQFNFDTRRRNENYQSQHRGSIVFANHARIIIRFNQKDVYTMQFFGDIIQNHTISDVPFEEIDAIIIGFFNSHHYISTETTFYKDMMKEYESGNSTVDFLHIDPPTVDFLAEHYSKPIIATSMFLNDETFIALANETSRIVSNLINRSNVRFIPARKYIDLLGNNLSCGADITLKKSVSGCAATETNHQCVGYRGSHPDLIAHDFVEAFYELL